MTSAQAASPEVGTAYYQYREDGLLSKKTLGNGCYTYFAYDEARRLTQLLNCFPDGRPLVYFEYGYDGATRITSVRREDATVIYYGYDLADRLTNEEWYDSGMNQLYTFQWDYDLAGNRTYERRGDVETYYTYNEANELLHARKLPAGLFLAFVILCFGALFPVVGPFVLGTIFFVVSIMVSKICDAVNALPDLAANTFAPPAVAAPQSGPGQQA
jgi:YD repeat-containing protein